jgi:hypothetical protein
LIFYQSAAKLTPTHLTPTKAPDVLCALNAASHVTSSPHPAAAKTMDLQIAPTNKEQIVLVDKMLGLITGGKTTGMDKQEEYTMTKALQLYRGYLVGKETITAKVPITLKINEPAKRNPERKGTRKVRS